MHSTASPRFFCGGFFLPRRKPSPGRGRCRHRRRMRSKPSPSAPCWGRMCRPPDFPSSGTLCQLPPQGEAVGGNRRCRRPPGRMRSKPSPSPLCSCRTAEKKKKIVFPRTLSHSKTETEKRIQKTGRETSALFGCIPAGAFIRQFVRFGFSPRGGRVRRGP